MRSRSFSKAAAVLLSAALTVPMMLSPAGTVLAADPGSSATIGYTFSGNQTTKAGYAEGTITFQFSSGGNYKLYWADDTKALADYAPLLEFSSSSGGTRSVQLGYHTVIPYQATKIIAATSSLQVSDAVCVYDIPQTKQLSHNSGELLYTFTSLSDLHIDERAKVWWVNAKTNLRSALQISAERQSDYVVVSGDCVTCSTLDEEWSSYERILSQSDFVNPIWECIGNHELKDDVPTGLEKYIRGTGTDGSRSSTPYYSMIEEKTGDLFIFMCLELSKDPNNDAVFSDPQLAWARTLIEQNYTSRNIFLVEHAPIRSYGAGDDIDNPHYGGLMDGDKGTNKQFKKILQDFPNIIFVSGHTHLDFDENYNYFNDNGHACHMIHNPSVGGTSKIIDGSMSYIEEGYGSQGYIVQVFENEVVFNGLDVRTNLYYPQYSYVMEGARTSSSAVNPAPAERPLKNKTVDITGRLAIVKAVLSDKYTYASYDSYQALKKLYYAYKDQTTADESVLDEFLEKLNALSVYTGDSTYYDLYDTYYFVNNQNWSSVYAYAWDNNGSKNAEWPGVKLSKVGADSNNKDVYKVAFNTTGEYPNLIFNNGSNEKQTVDLSLVKFQYNGFSIKGTSGNKYTVNNFAVDPNDFGGTVVIPEPDETYALLYYVADEHDWTNVDTFLQPDGTGSYKLTYTPKSTNNFSCSLYNKKTGKYICLSTSAKFDFAAGQTFEQTLEEHSSRGKSITVYGMSTTNLLDIVFTPSTNKITITCRVLGQDPLENLSQISAETALLGDEVLLTGAAQGGTSPYTYAFYYKKSTDAAWTAIGTPFGTQTYAAFQPDSVGEYQAKVTVKDSTGATADKEFALSVSKKELRNLSTISSTSVPQRTTIFVRGASEGGEGTCKYAFYYKKASSKTWTIIGELYGSMTEVSFFPSTVATYYVRVNVKDESGTIATQIFELTSTKPTGNDLVNNSTVDKTTTQRNTPITITAAAAGGEGAYRFAFYYKKSTSKGFTAIGTPYGDATTATFTPASTAEYYVRINVQDSAGTIVTRQYTITATAVTNDLSNLSTISAAEVTKGTAVTLTAQASGGTAPYTYAFYYKKSTSSGYTKIGTEFGTDTTATFTPTMKATYNVKIVVKDSTGKTAQKTFTVTAS